MNGSNIKKQLMAKARGFTIAIDKMTDKQHEQEPNGNFADDYNKLRNLTEQHFSQIRNLLPPIVATFESDYGQGGSYAVSCYAEISTYCEQLFQLLSECD